MYYIISEEGSQILDTSSAMSDEIILGYANQFQCAIYAIRGEHSGYAAVPQVYTPPAVVYEAPLEVRAGSPVDALAGLWEADH